MVHSLINAGSEKYTLIKLPQYYSAENSLRSLGGQTVHQNESSSGPPEKLGAHITLITNMVANSHFITETSWLIE